MSFLSRVVEGAASLRVDEGHAVTATDVYGNEAGGILLGDNTAGQRVTVHGALSLAPFWRGVNLLSSQVGMLPLKVYGPLKSDGSRDLATKTNAWRVLHDRPSDNLPVDEFWALTQCHLDTWGNAFLFKVRDLLGLVASMRHIHPGRVVVKDSNGVRTFEVWSVDGTVETFTTRDVLHIRGLGSMGVRGWSPVEVHRRKFGSALARDEFAQRFWENDATPGVTLVHPGKITPEATSRIRALWDNAHRGGANRRRTAVLAENISVEQMTMPLKDAQYIEGMRMDATQQALILGIPISKLAGDNGGNSLTYTTTEGQSLDFYKDSLGPRLGRIQKAVAHDGDLMPEGFVAEFDAGDVLRTTRKEQFEAWAVAPHLMIDEMRAMDGRPPLPNGAGAVLSKSTPVASDGPAAAGDKPDEGEDE